MTPAEPYRPVSLDREYVFPWTNQWQDQKCSETVFVLPERNDIDAATVNLFAMHNRLHDWAYFLGFTERNFNAQDNNFGNTAPGPYPTGREFDAEIGNSQAGAVSGGPPSYLGRDNANQITLNDGVPPITNMYLWQPIAGAFYAPCVDGDYDMAVIGHEYTHLISNRMVGGPDSNLTGAQAGAMGESWGDLDGVEYLNEYGFVPTNGENPFSVGAYATGNGERGIRNYDMSRHLTPPNGTPSAGLGTTNPLNYSDIGYDMTGPQVHADGEIWSATNYDIRQALIAKYNASFPATNAAMQRECADAIRPSYLCPGNRRWIQIVFDAWLLMPATVSFLDARDAYIAADQMRAAGTPGGGWPSNLKELWKAFAQRGMGYNASSVGSDDPDPIPNFESLPGPDLEVEKTVRFRVWAADEGNAPITNAKIFVGHYEARAVPIADTNPGTASPTDTAKFVTGLYDFLVQAPGYGHVRFDRFFSATGGTQTVDVFMSTNRASLAKGAVASGTGSHRERPDRRYRGHALDGHRPREPAAGDRRPPGRRPERQAGQRQRDGQPEPHRPFQRAPSVRDPDLHAGSPRSDLRAPHRFHDHLHQRGQRLPRGRPPADGARPDHSKLRRAGHQRDARAAQGADQPVHRDRDPVPWRPGQQPLERLRLRLGIDGG